MWKKFVLKFNLWAHGCCTKHGTTKISNVTNIHDSADWYCPDCNREDWQRFEANEEKKKRKILDLQEQLRRLK